MHPFQINFLDHVAIKVNDMAISIEWYEKVIGLKRVDLPEWKNYPAMMFAGKTGVAIFPAKQDENNSIEKKQIRIDHFAFNVSRENFEAAKRHYESIGQPYSFQDHFYFHSIYTNDPDGHIVELTTLVTDEGTVYRIEHG